MKQRKPIVFLALSALGLTFIASDEGYRDACYNDGGGVQTVGFGTTTHPDGSPVQRGDKTTIFPSFGGEFKHGANLKGILSL